MSLLLDVTRHPYSFRGDSPQPHVPEGKEKTWHEGLLGYVGGDPRLRDSAEAQMRMLGERCGIHLDYNVQTNWQPVDSQRVMLWARQFGKAELYMNSLARKHFEERTSASHRPTLLEAAEEAGLDVEAARAFLETDELRAEVWRSYGSTIHEKGIHSIPLFVFNSQLSDGGPFRSGKGRPTVVHGSGGQEEFLEVFDCLFLQVERSGNL